MNMPHADTTTVYRLPSQTKQHYLEVDTLAKTVPYFSHPFLFGHRDFEKDPSNLSRATLKKIIADCNKINRHM